jgi:hypothetical protein
MGRPRKFFDGACRIRAWRAERADQLAAVTKGQARLSFETRQSLRAEIDRRLRAKLAETDFQDAERLLALFRDKRPA